MQRRVLTLVTAVVAATLLLSACGGGGGVGGDLGKVKGEGGKGAIGQATTTAPPVTAPVTTVTTAKAAAPTTAKPVAAAPSATYTINNDTKGQYIEPLSHTVRAGQLVRFTNADDKAHVILGKSGDTVVMGPSPSIPPGGQWDVKPTAVGTYDIVDEQRTYAQGVTLTVSR